MDPHNSPDGILLLQPQASVANATQIEENLSAINVMAAMSIPENGGLGYPKCGDLLMVVY